MDDYLSKPFKLDALSRVLESWLPSKTMTDPFGPTGAGEGPAREEPENREPVRVCPTRHRTLGGPDASEGGFLERLFLLESVDRQALENLRAIKSDRQPSLLLKVIRRYLENSPVLMETLCLAISSGDAAYMKTAAHSLMSANGFLGAKRLMELCKELQNLGETGAVEEAVPLLRAK